MRIILTVAVGTFLSAVAFAGVNGPVFNPGKIEPSLIRNPNLRAAAQRLKARVEHKHLKEFIGSEIYGCESSDGGCEQAGRAYYRRIGVLDSAGKPTAARGTMQAWMKLHGFSPVPTKPVADELRAVYYNRADLGFGRDMHCRAYFRAARLGLAAGNVTACYVTNFGDKAEPEKPNGNEEEALAKAMSGTSPIATVAMEVFRPLGRGVNPEVRFLVYKTTTSLTGALVGTPLVAAQLDSERAKENPGVCMNCHGGEEAIDASKGPPIVGANFLPFDAQEFGYACNGGRGMLNPFPIQRARCSQTQWSESAQRETFRKLNAMVRATKPAATAITAQIDGWYGWCGGVSKPGCHIDDTNHPSTPASWLAAGKGGKVTNFGGASKSVGTPEIVALYQEVARKYCRTCHLARPEYDVQDASQAALLKLKLDPGQLESNMPNAERAFRGYWNNKGAKEAYKVVW